MTLMKIGEVAKQFNVKADTLRFYEKNGLVGASGRSQSGYRLYNSDDIQRLSFIMRAKAVGFSLADIQDLLSIELDKSNWACADVKNMVDTKLSQIEAKLAELNRFRSSLKSLSDACCGGPDSAEYCSILEALESQNATE
ncbi:Zn(2+)-responsive transcriptional regulator [Paraferrimonas haliotis]|uniref:Heavy metal-responsive transcriptional regulator n=1 Tax=Paraferrimonas haliotis TaxID=2013866 RepID=A0AA37TVG9_9GAMM|nr:Zn(2+)-responsive transcriptional regulator [Paraferrimonas haliotis]GLS83455.1 heavy metal-responsive transcriptional regulator [Paraferrimonas haliotis]